MTRFHKQDRRSFLKTVAATGSYALLSQASALGADGSTPPNIVIFLVDDMGLMDTSVPMLADTNGKPQSHPLNDWYRTPNMENLAASGIRFSHFYAHSVCSPTRASILTGQNSARHATTTWIKPTSNNRDKYGPPNWNWDGLEAGDVTLPGLLRRGGYRTIHVGKAHFGHQGSEGEDPTNLGFDINIGGTYAGRPGSYYGQEGYGAIKGDKYRAVPHLKKYHGTDTYLTEALTLEANAAVDTAIAAGKPFFLYMSHYAVHSPFQSDPRFADHYKNSNKSGRAQAYATMIEGIDKSLGDIVDNLKARGVAQDTLIIFLGDNGSDAPLGPTHGYSSSAPLLGKKGTHHEGGMRVPFIAAWAKPDPDNPLQTRLPIAAGQIQSQLGTVCDLMPTICGLTETQLPADHSVDGFDLREQFAGKIKNDRSNLFVNHFPHEHRSSYYTSFVKDGWKLVYLYPLGRDKKYELYNLKEDPYEKINLSSERPEILQRMLTDLKREMQSYGALPPQKDGKELRI